MKKDMRNAPGHSPCHQEVKVKTGNRVSGIDPSEDKAVSCYSLDWGWTSIAAIGTRCISTLET